MADVVQFKLERMLNELDDLERRGLFNRREIAEIVKRRRKFEYRLKRPSPLKKDFIDYIEYEKQLDALRLLRKKSLLKESGSKTSKKSVSDYAGVSRILEIYRLATNRFKGDIELWFQYLEFCKARGNGKMKKALAQLIRFHPKVASVWIYAAAWEFDHNLNVAAARALMQNGLRACPSSEDLWVEYIRMELTYLNKLKARKVALGEDEGNLTHVPRGVDEKQWREENKELFMALSESRDEDKMPAFQDGESGRKVDMFGEHGLNILQTVYSGAIDALPTSLSLRTKFLEILEVINLSHSEDIRKKILDEMKRDFSKEPQYWDWLARVEIDNLKGLNPEKLGKAIQVYEEGLTVLPSAAMFNVYVKFLMDAASNENRDGETAIHFTARDHAVDLVSHLQIVFEKAESLGCLTEDLACQHVSFLLQLGKLDEARKLIEMLCSEKFSNAVHLWTLRLSIEMRYVQDKSVSPSKADQSSIFELLRTILVKVSVSEAENIWLMGLKYFVNQRSHFFDKLVETSVILLAKDGGSDCGFSLAYTIVDYILQRDGVDSARNVYKRFLALPHPGLAMFRNCIELELNLASAGDKAGLSNARKLYESALATYDQDSSLWRDYYSMEVKMGTSETAAAVHWRAMKVLKNGFTLISTSL